MRFPIPPLALSSILISVGCAPYVGVVIPPPGGGGPPVYNEREPNDTPFNPDPIGVVDFLTYLVVAGHVEPPGGWDVYDHFEFVAAGPATFDFVLEGFSPFSDMDLSLWDPDLGQIVATWDSPLDPEFGTFTVVQPGKVFVLLVEAYGAPGPYELELMGRPVSYFSGDDSSHDDSRANAGVEGGAGLDSDSGDEQPSAFLFPDGKPKPFK